MKQFLIFLLFIFPVSVVLAQEVQVSDTGKIYPFRGTICYKVSYLAKIKKAPDIRSNFPDSMVLILDHPWVQQTYYRGASDSLMHRIRWNAETGESELIFPAREYYYTVPASYAAPAATVSPLDQKSGLINGRQCNQFKVTYKDNPVTDWFWTSDSLIAFPKAEGDTALPYRPPFLLPEIPGIPLKHTRKEPQGNTTTEFIEIRAGDVPDKFWAIPESYGYRVFSPRSSDRFPILK